MIHLRVPHLKTMSQVGRFVLVGGTGSLLLLGETYVLTEYLRLWYFWAFLISAVCNWTFLFFSHAFFTFDSRTKLGATKYAVFVGIYCTALLANATIVYFLTSIGGSHYLISILVGTAVSTVITFTLSRTYVYAQEDMHPSVARVVTLLKVHVVALLLAVTTALIVLTPNALLWAEPEFQGIEMMMLDAENHYLARITEISQGHIMAGNTFLPDKTMPYATPPLGEMVIALFGKVFNMEPARAAIVSKSISVFVITLLVYALAFALSSSRVASLISAGAVMLGNNLIGFSPAPFLELLNGSPSGGPFLFFSRLVNPSVSGVFLFGVLLLIYREFFVQEKTSWRRAIMVGVLVGLSLYITPYTYSFLGLVVLLVFLWFVVKREYEHSFSIFLCGIVGLLLSVPFLINYVALTGLPGYENFTRFLGLVERREFILGALLPLMVAVAVFFWPRPFPKIGRTFFLIVCVALFFLINQQLVTGTYLQHGHYHWYITKPLAGLLGGLVLGYLLERFLAPRLRVIVTVLILGILVYNSMGFLAPWYGNTKAMALSAQSNGPLVKYLGTIPESQVVWADGDTSDHIPIYTVHHAPNSVNVGAYPIPVTFFENRLFLEYRLRNVSSEQFESVIRRESHHVGDRLWGMWLREKFGDPSAVPEEEFERLAQKYTVFSALSWSEAFNTLSITRVVARTGEEEVYAKIPSLKESARAGDFVVYELK